MEERLSSFCLGQKSADPFSSQPQNRKMTQGLYFPAYIFTNSFNSPHLPVLQKQLQKQKIMLSFQNSTEKLSKMKNTHQSRIFVILNDMSDQPALFSNMDETEYQIVNYPSIDVEKIIDLYRQFVEQQLSKNNCKTNLTLKVPNRTKGQLLQSGLKSSLQQSIKQKTLVKFRNMSKIISNYKVTWPKKLFIYSNKHDDQTYRKYVSLIQGMVFNDACFINQIQEYIKLLPDKEESCFCVLMSQYSALNLRKFFKNVDEIILFGMNTQKCVPLLRGKVTFFTTQIESLDKLLIDKFGMKEKKLISSAENLKCELQSTGQFEFELDKKYKTMHQHKQDSIHQRHETKLKGLPHSVPNLIISQQFSLMNEPVRSLEIQSNIIDFNYCLHSSVMPDVIRQQPDCVRQQEEKVQVSRKNITLSKQELFKNFKRDYPMFSLKEMVDKVNPLKIVQLQMASIANISIKSSQVSHERQLFQQLIDRLNKETSIAQIKVEESQLVGNHRQTMKLSNCKQNSVNSLKSSQCSRYSQGSSRNSRIMNRIKQSRAKNQQKLNE